MATGGSMTDPGALVGQRVVLCGLNKTELNGSAGEALLFDEQRGRYGVRLDGASEVIAIKPINLQRLPDAQPEAQTDAEPPAVLSEEELGLELLECARYGEVDETRQMLASGANVDFKDAGGNTALHRASANGHVSVLKVLVEAGATQLPNESGNLPLHWAVQQGQLEAVKALLELFPEVDVLAQNAFGKSVSTEAFARGDAAIVEAVLSHSSARKLDPEEAEGAEDGEISAEVTHEFDFGRGQPRVWIRELAGVGGSDTPERVLGASAAEDKTGLQLWAASVVMSRWLLERRDEIRDRRICELGAGCGLCGIVASKLCGAKEVVITDLADHTLANLQHNLQINALGATATSSVLDWGNPNTFPPLVEVLIGSDLVYSSEAVPQLLQVVKALLAPGGAFLYIAPETNRQGEQEFLDGLVIEGFERQEHSVPEAYLANALADRTDEEFYLLFFELKQRTYTLYRFLRPSDAIGSASAGVESST